MKVAFFTVFFLEQGGGLAKYFTETASNLAKMPSVKADVITMDDNFNLNIMRLTHVFYMANFRKMDMKLIYKENIKTIMKNLESARYFKVGSLSNLKQKLQEYDVIYCKNEVLESFILKFLIGYEDIPPVIFGCHTPFFYSQTSSFQSKLHNFLYNSFVYKFLASDVKAFHVLNSFDEKILVKMFPNKKVIKIYNTLNVNEFINLSKKYVFNHKSDKDKFNILWLGRFSEGKGLPELTNIIDNLNNSGYANKLVFNIVGDGSKILRQLIEDKVKKWSNVKYFGSVEHKYTPSIYKNNNLFLCTSKWETFSYTILEAQACGLPVIAFNIPGGPRDIIESGKTGYLVDDDEELSSTIIRIQKNRKIFDAEKIKKIIQDKFNPDKIYSQLYNMLFSNVEEDK